MATGSEGRETLWKHQTPGMVRLETLCALGGPGRVAQYSFLSLGWVKGTSKQAKCKQ